MPPELIEKGDGYVPLGELTTDFLASHAVSKPDIQLMNVIYARIGTTKITSMDFTWVEKWIPSMKSELKIKPGTIRHYVGALLAMDAGGCLVPHGLGGHARTLLNAASLRLGA